MFAVSCSCFMCRPKMCIIFLFRLVLFIVVCCFVLIILIASILNIVFGHDGFNWVSVCLLVGLRSILYFILLKDAVPVSWPAPDDANVSEITPQSLFAGSLRLLRLLSTLPSS